MFEKIANTLEKTYTIFQQTTPPIFIDCIIRGGEFKNFNDLFTKICFEKLISKSKPSMLLNLNYITDILKAVEFTIGTKTLAIQDCTISLLSDYTSNPINIRKINAKHAFKGKKY